MQFGMFFLASSADGDHHADYAELLEQVEYAEELGFDAIWSAEHHSGYGMTGHPAVLLAAIAQRTKRIRIGCGVSILPFQNPVRVAEDYALVDVLSGGRLNFGADRANQRKEYHMMRADREHSKEVFWESIDIIRDLWRGETVTFHGEHFNFDEIQTFPRPLQTPVPMFVAAVSRESFLKAAERGYQVMSAEVGDWDEFADRIATAKQLLAAHGPRDMQPRFAYMAETYVAETPARARAEFMLPFFRLFQLVKGANPLGTIPDKDFEYYAKEASVLRAYATPEELIDGWSRKTTQLVSDPDGVTRKIRRMHEAGVTDVVCTTALGGLKHELVMKSMRLFAEEVMPAFGPPATHASTRAGVV